MGVIRTRDVTPGTGIAGLTFGMGRSQAEDILGLPADVKEVEGPDEGVVVWVYQHNLLILTFDMPFDQLVKIEAQHRGAKVWGVNIANRPLDAVLSDLSAAGHEGGEADDTGWAFADDKAHLTVRDGTVVAVEAWA